MREVSSHCFFYFYINIPPKPIEVIPFNYLSDSAFNFLPFETSGKNYCYNNNMI